MADQPSTLISVRLRPRSGRDEVVGWTNGVLQARVTAPPVEGRANKALCTLLARTLGLAPTRVAVVRGEGARLKTVLIDGLSEAEVIRRLGDLRRSPPPPAR